MGRQATTSPHAHDHEADVMSADFLYGAEVDQHEEVYDWVSRTVVRRRPARRALRSSLPAHAATRRELVPPGNDVSAPAAGRGGLGHAPPPDREARGDASPHSEDPSNSPPGSRTEARQAPVGRGDVRPGSEARPRCVERPSTRLDAPLDAAQVADPEPNAGAGGGFGAVDPRGLGPEPDGEASALRDWEADREAEEELADELGEDLGGSVDWVDWGGEPSVVGGPDEYLAGVWVYEDDERAEAEAEEASGASAGRVEDRHWRARWVEGLARQHGPDARGYAVLEGILAESDNPSATATRVSELLDQGITWEQLALCHDLRHAWSERADLGRRLPFFTKGTAYCEAVDLSLTWSAAFQLVDAFGSVPQLDELLLVLEEVRELWRRRFFAVEAHKRWSGTSGIDRPHPYFVTFAVAWMRRHPCPWMVRA